MKGVCRRGLELGEVKVKISGRFIFGVNQERSNAHFVRSVVHSNQSIAK